MEITKSDETALYDWFDLNREEAIDEGFTVGELVFDGNTGKARIYRKGLVNTDVTIQLMKCPNYDVNRNCTGWIEKSTAELEADRDEAIEARLKGIAEVAKQRIAKQLEAKVGKGDITVNVK